jgi:hypothetical protein
VEEFVMPRIIGTKNPVVVDKCGWRIKEWGPAVGLRTARVNELIADRTIDSVKAGGARIILTPPREFLNSYRETAA